MAPSVYYAKPPAIYSEVFVKTVLFVLAALVISPLAFADYILAHNGKKVECYGEDNQSWELNAKRTAVKYIVEGESEGPKKILKVKTDRNTFVSYITSEGALTLSDQGDTYQPRGEAEFPVRCR